MQLSNVFRVALCVVSSDTVESEAQQYHVSYIRLCTNGFPAVEFVDCVVYVLFCLRNLSYQEFVSNVAFYKLLALYRSNILL